MRVAVVSVLTAAAAAFGWWLRPSAQEAPTVVGPSIAVYASSPGVSADVTMTLTIGQDHNSRSNVLNVQISVLSALKSPVTLVAVLSNVPQLAALSDTSLSPIPGSFAATEVQPQKGLASYAAVGQVAPLAAAGRARAPSLNFTVQAAAPIGEAMRGSQLRVAFPAVIGEVPGDYTPSGFSSQALFPGRQQVLDLPSVMYQPVLQAATSKFSNEFVKLSGYQILAGDPPALLGSEWTWNGVNTATVLAASVAGQDTEQQHLFWSGIILGVAGAGFITAMMELLTALKTPGAARKRRAGSAAPPAGENAGR